MVSRVQGALVLSVTASDDSITINNWESSSSFRVERVGFADGAAWDTGQLDIAKAVGVTAIAEAFYMS